MSDTEGTTWVRLTPGVVAEVSYSHMEYQMGDDEVEGKLTGRLRMTTEAVQNGMWGLDPTAEEDSAT